MPPLAQTRFIAETDLAVVDQVIEALEAGHPVIVPTDTVYGLAVRAGDPDALELVFALKDRPAERSVAVLVSDAAQAETIAIFGDAERRLAQQFWPGGLTIVAPAVPGADIIAASDNTIGVRVPDRNLLRRVCAQIGPLATTSANRSGYPTPPGAHAAASALTAPVVLVVDGGDCGGAPSSVVRCGPQSLDVIRVGAIAPNVLASGSGLRLAPNA